MKKIVLSLIAITMILVGCSTSTENKEEVKDYKTELVDVVLDYKTIEEVDDSLSEGDKVVKTEGKKGFRVEVYKINEDGTKELLNYWTYEDPIHEVVKVGTKNDESLVDNDSSHVNDNTSNQNNNNNTTPPSGGGNTSPGGGTSNGGSSNGGNSGGSAGGNTTPPAPKPEPKPEPEPDVCAVYPGNDGNEWWSSYESANSWAWEETMMKENSPFFLMSYLVASKGSCGWYIVFR